MDRNTSPKMATEADRLVGLRLAALRKTKGLSQTDLGKAVGVTFQQVQKYEKGQNRVGAGRLRAFAQYLEVPISVFFEEGRSDDERTELFDHLRTPGAVDLLRAFAAIGDDRLRCEIVALARSAARIELRAGEG